MLKIISFAQKILYIPLQALAAVLMLAVYVLVAVAVGLNRVVPVSKLLAPAIAAVPELISHYGIKYYVTYALMAVICAVGLYVYWDPVWLLATYFMILVLGIGSEMALHRYFSHRSFKCNPIWEKVLHVFAILSFEGPVIGYSAMHRTHHKHSDSAEDPIPGHVWHATFTSFYTIPFERYSKMTVRDLLLSPWNIFTNANYYTLYIGMMSLACAVDYKMACYLLIFPSLFCIIPSTIVNWRCHTAGERPWATQDSSTNNIMANWLIVGQGLHNNHHADAAAYHMERAWWQFDFYRPLIKMIATEVREPKNDPAL